MRTDAIEHVSVAIKSRKFVTMVVNKDGKEIIIKPVPYILSRIRKYSEKTFCSFLIIIVVSFVYIFSFMNL